MFLCLEALSLRDGFCDLNTPWLFFETVLFRGVGYMDKKREKEIMEQLFDEMKQGEVRTYSEMQQRKAELMSKSASSKTAAEVKSIKKLIPKIMLFAVAFILLLFAIHFFGALRMPASQTTYNGLSAENDPTQTETTATSFSVTTLWKKWYITPMAEYKIVAKVKSKHKIFFFQDDVAQLGKYDLALAWGKLIKPEYDEYIKYYQSGRKYTVVSSADCPLSMSYISNHSANNHIIAANNAVLRGVKNIKKNDIVYMEGYLVNAFRQGEGGYNSWDTSLARNDNSSDGGCEVFYVKKLQIGKKTYE